MSLEDSILMAFPCFVVEVKHEGLMGGGFQSNDFKSVAFSASSCLSTTAFISFSILKAINRKKLKQSSSLIQKLTYLDIKSIEIWKMNSQGDYLPGA